MSDYQTDHAKRRLRERHDLCLGERDWRQAFLDIVDGRSRFIHRRNGQERHVVKLGDHDAHVIYDPQQAKIITVLWRKHRVRVWHDEEVML